MTDHEQTQEEYEYYDMSGFEQKIMKRLDQMDVKLSAVLDEVEDNNHRLKGIQFNFTRALILRVLKLAIIGGIIFYLYNNFISPIIFSVSERYYQAELLLDKVDAVNKNSSGLGETFQRLFPTAGDALDTIRPGIESGSGGDE